MSLTPRGHGDANRDGHRQRRETDQDRALSLCDCNHADGKTTYVVNQFSMVTPITIATNTSGTPIKAGARPHAILIVP